MLKPPARIYLQGYNEDGNLKSEITDETYTWCSDKINDNDVEYIRNDLYEQLLRNYNQLQGMYVEELKNKDIPDEGNQEKADKV